MVLVQVWCKHQGTAPRDGFPYGGKLDDSLTIAELKAIILKQLNETLARESGRGQCRCVEFYAQDFSSFVPDDDAISKYCGRGEAFFIFNSWI